MERNDHVQTFIDQSNQSDIDIEQRHSRSAMETPQDDIGPSGPDRFVDSPTSDIPAESNGKPSSDRDQQDLLSGLFEDIQQLVDSPQDSAKGDASQSEVRLDSVYNPSLVTPGAPTLPSARHQIAQLPYHLSTDHHSAILSLSNTSSGRVPQKRHLSSHDNKETDPKRSRRPSYGLPKPLVPQKRSQLHHECDETHYKRTRNNQWSEIPSLQPRRPLVPLYQKCISRNHEPSPCQNPFEFTFTSRLQNPSSSSNLQLPNSRLNGPHSSDSNLSNDCLPPPALVLNQEEQHASEHAQNQPCLLLASSPGTIQLPDSRSNFCLTQLQEPETHQQPALEVTQEDKQAYEDTQNQPCLPLGQKVYGELQNHTHTHLSSIHCDDGPQTYATNYSSYLPQLDHHTSKQLSRLPRPNYPDSDLRSIIQTRPSSAPQLVALKSAFGKACHATSPLRAQSQGSTRRNSQNASYADVQISIPQFLSSSLQDVTCESEQMIKCNRNHTSSVSNRGLFETDSTGLLDPSHIPRHKNSLSTSFAFGQNQTSNFTSIPHLALSSRPTHEQPQKQCHISQQPQAYPKASPSQPRPPSRMCIQSPDSQNNQPDSCQSGRSSRMSISSRGDSQRSPQHSSEIPTTYQHPHHTHGQPPNPQTPNNFMQQTQAHPSQTRPQSRICVQTADSQQTRSTSCQSGHPSMISRRSAHNSQPDPQRAPDVPSTYQHPPLALSSRSSAVNMPHHLNRSENTKHLRVIDHDQSEDRENFHHDDPQIYSRGFAFNSAPGAYPQDSTRGIQGPSPLNQDSTNSYSALPIPSSSDVYRSHQSQFNNQSSDFDLQQHLIYQPEVFPTHREPNVTPNRIQPCLPAGNQPYEYDQRQNYSTNNHTHIQRDDQAQNYVSNLDAHLTQPPYDAHTRNSDSRLPSPPSSHAHVQHTTLHHSPQPPLWGGFQFDSRGNVISTLVPPAVNPGPQFYNPRPSDQPSHPQREIFQQPVQQPQPHPSVPASLSHNSPSSRLFISQPKKNTQGNSSQRGQISKITSVVHHRRSDPRAAKAAAATQRKSTPVRYSRSSEVTTRGAFTRNETEDDVESIEHDVLMDESIDPAPAEAVQEDELMQLDEAIEEDDPIEEDEAMDDNDSMHDNEEDDLDLMNNGDTEDDELDPDQETDKSDLEGVFDLAETRKYQNRKSARRVQKTRARHNGVRLEKLAKTPAECSQYERLTIAIQHYNNLLLGIVRKGKGRKGNRLLPSPPSDKEYSAWDKRKVDRRRLVDTSSEKACKLYRRKHPRAHPAQLAKVAENAAEEAISTIPPVTFTLKVTLRNSGVHYSTTVASTCEAALALAGFVRFTYDWTDTIKSKWNEAVSIIIAQEWEKCYKRGDADEYDVDINHVTAKNIRQVLDRWFNTKAREYLGQRRVEARNDHETQLAGLEASKEKSRRRNSQKRVCKLRQDTLKAFFPENRALRQILSVTSVHSEDEVESAGNSYRIRKLWRHRDLVRFLHELDKLCIKDQDSKQASTSVAKALQRGPYAAVKDVDYIVRPPKGFPKTLLDQQFIQQHLPRVTVLGLELSTKEYDLTPLLEHAKWLQVPEAS